MDHDCSPDDGRVVCAAVSDAARSSLKLHGYSSIFTAELYGILCAIAIAKKSTDTEMYADMNVRRRNPPVVIVSVGTAADMAGPSGTAVRRNPTRSSGASYADSHDSGDSDEDFDTSSLQIDLQVSHLRLLEFYAFPFLRLIKCSEDISFFVYSAEEFFNEQLDPQEISEGEEYRRELEDLQCATLDRVDERGGGGNEDEEPSKTLATCDGRDEEDISGDDSAGENRAYIPPDGATSSRDDEHDDMEEDPAPPDETPHERHLRWRRTKRRLNALKKGKVIKRRSGYTKTMPLPMFNKKGEPYSTAPSALASRRKRLVRIARGEGIGPKSAPPKRRVLTQKRLRDVSSDDDDEGRLICGDIDIFKTIPSTNPDTGDHAEQFLCETEKEDMEKMLGDSSAMLYNMEKYLVKVEARNTIKKAFSNASKKKRKIPAPSPMIRYSDEFGPAPSLSGSEATTQEGADEALPSSQDSQSEPSCAEEGD
ncbi:hypothetical protein HAZT_HAZT002399, partial [Hyalella azteca]